MDQGAVAISIGDAFKDLVWDNLVKAAISELFTAAPYLAWGPVGWVVSFTLTYFAGKLYGAIVLAVSLEATVIKNEALRSAYDKAQVTLKIIAHDKGIDSKEFKDAKEDAKLALSRFVSLD